MLVWPWDSIVVVTLVVGVWLVVMGGSSRSCGDSRCATTPRPYARRESWYAIALIKPRRQADPATSTRTTSASRVADATAALATGMVGAAVEAVIGGIRRYQGAAKGIRDGWITDSQSRRLPR